MRKTIYNYFSQHSYLAINNGDQIYIRIYHIKNNAWILLSSVFCKYNKTLTNYLNWVLYSLTALHYFFVMNITLPIFQKFSLFKHNGICWNTKWTYNIKYCYYYTTYQEKYCAYHLYPIKFILSINNIYLLLRYLGEEEGIKQNKQ